jgi:hypothetical protein
VAGPVHRRALRLDEERRGAGLGGAAREEVDAAVDQAVYHAHPAIAIERGHEDLAAAAPAAHLGVVERRAVEVARLGRGGEMGTAGLDAVERRQVVELAAAVPPPGARQV